jgi:hypothetical protein
MPYQSVNYLLPTTLLTTVTLEMGHKRTALRVKTRKFPYETNHHIKIAV